MERCRFASRPLRCCLLLVSLGLAGPAAALDYELEIAARTDTVIGGKTITSLFGIALGETGEVVFRAAFAGGQGIFTPTALLAQTGQSIGGKTLVTIGDPAIGPTGDVFFFGSYIAGSGIFTPLGQLIGTTSTIGGQTVSNISSRAYVSSANVPAFRVSFSTGAPAMVTPTSIELIRDQLIDGEQIQSFASGVEADPINANGVVAANVNFQGGGEGIVTPGGILVAEGDTIDGIEIVEILNNVDMNDAGTIVFTATFAGGNGIFTQSALLASDDDVIDGRAVTGYFPPAINDAGTVAFTGQYRDTATNQQRSGIFTLDDQLAALFETTVDGDLLTGLLHDRPALNDAGQVAFFGGFSNAGYNAVLVATPAPDAESTVAGAVALLALGRAAARRRPSER